MISDDQWQTGFVYLNVDDPAVAWMVYRGELVSASAVAPWALSFWTADHLRKLASGARSDRWFAEQRLEELRRIHFQQCASRLAGFYVFADYDSAQAAKRWRVPQYRSELREEVAIRPGSRVSRYDAEWITEKLAFDESDTWMHRYFAGDACNNEPIWELVVEGSALIFGTAVRNRAYEVVKATWPDSLGLLELARVAVELDSALGRTIQSVSETDQGWRVDFVLDFHDATHEDFLNRLANFDGPKNTGDLNATTDLVVPDLHSRSFIVPRSGRLLR